MSQLAPLTSVVTVVGTLLFLVFLQMEERRLGYSVLKLGRIYREKLEEKHYKEIQLARSLRLGKMEALAARKLTLRRAADDQVIHLNDEEKSSSDETIVAITKDQKEKNKGISIKAGRGVQARKPAEGAVR